MFGALIGKNVTVNGRRTSMRLEGSMWDALADIGAREGVTLHALVSQIEARAQGQAEGRLNLASAVRSFVATYYRAAATADGHRRAGHGLGDPFAGAALGPSSPADTASRPRRLGRPPMETCLSA